MGFGDYPKEYNPAVHGPYDPARFYGKPDTPFSQVKLSEIGSWFARRNKSPSAMMGAVSRAWWRWQHKYVQPKRVGMAPFFQLMVGSMTFFYLINYGKIITTSKLALYVAQPFKSLNKNYVKGNGLILEHHRNYKYH